MTKKNIVILWSMLWVLIGCSSDDDTAEDVAEVLNDVGEQAATDDEKLITYLKTHFYNKEDFLTPSEDFDGFMKFDTISGDHADKTPLIEDQDLQLDTLTIENRGAAHKLYVLKHRLGSGAVKATIVDSVLISYRAAAVYEEGFFDSKSSPEWFDLIIKSLPTGFMHGLREARGSAGGASFEEDGRIKFSDDYGIGAVFMPSGLGFFNGNLGGVISDYSSLYYTFKVYKVLRADHDNDGVSSRDEALDADRIYEEIKDTDGDDILDVYDTDDDNDGVATLDEKIEKEDTNADGKIDDQDDYPDTDGDGTPDYLDADTP